ncbi:MAG TPA: recombinase RecT [Candidatus Mediterraneibacter merdigallinarum]|nr:recombinase RecT [Candidatus Mediterraneibacter merdigallinarum]
MAVQNSLAKRPTKTGLTAYLTQDAVKRQINSVVGGKNGTRFISSIVSAVQTTPALQECTNPSILSAALLGEALNLSPSPQLGQFYMVPFDNKKKGVKEAQFQLGYKGYIQLAVRSGYYKRLNVMAIKEGELVRYDPLNEEIEVNLIEDDIVREETPTTGYFAMFEYENGFKKTMYWSKQKMLSHADKYSQAFHVNAVESDNPRRQRVSYEDYLKGNYPKSDEWKYSSFWYKDFDGMAMKTMLRQLISKWGIMSIDLQTAVDKDMAVIHEDGSAEYVENEQEDVNVVADQELNEVLEEPQKAEPVQAVDAAKPGQETNGQMRMEEAFFSQP